MGAGLILEEKSLGLGGFSSFWMLAEVFWAVVMLGLASSGVCSLGIRGAVVFCQGGKSTGKKMVSLHLHEDASVRLTHMVCGDFI